MAAELVIAARNGDAAAFARLVQHWDPYLRRFVHHTMAGDGSPDRILAAAYVRAYRALPRYQAELTPGLWLHRIVFRAAGDELRRLGQDPERRRRRAPAVTEDPSNLLPGPRPPRAWRRLTAEDRALVTMVDLEGFLPEAAAEAIGVPEAAAEARLVTPRRVLTRPDRDHGDATGGARTGPAAPAPDRQPSPLPGTTPSTTDPDADATPPLVGPSATGPDPTEWTVRILEPGDYDDAPGDDPDETVDDEFFGFDDPDNANLLAGEELAAASRSLLIAVPVAAPSERFWSDLGKRLVAERARPAIDPIDPQARLGRTHPATPGFEPAGRTTGATAPAPAAAQSSTPTSSPGSVGAASGVTFDDTVGDRSAAVTTLADQADWTRPPRSWGRIAAISAAVVAVIALIVVAAAIGLSGRTPDGSVSARELAATTSDALAASAFSQVEARVEDPSLHGDADPRPYQVVLADTGSWAVSGTEHIEAETYHAGLGLQRRVGIEVAEGAEPSVVVIEDVGLAAGAPDPGPNAPAVVDELAGLTSMLRAADDERADASTYAGMNTWSFEATASVPRTGASGEEATGTVDETRRVEVRRSDSLPLLIEVRRDGDLVRRLRFSGWQPRTDTTDATFVQELPEGQPPTSTDHGFSAVEVAAVSSLGRGEAITPAWLPSDFELALTTIRPEPPEGATTTGDGANPPDQSVASIRYQRGPEQVTVSTRQLTGEASAWSDPFPATGGDADERRLGDGRFSGATASISTDGWGRAHLWGVDDGLVFTVSGDLTADEAFNVAASLR